MDYNRAINLSEVGKEICDAKKEYFGGIGFERLERDFTTLSDCFSEIKSVLSDNGGVWYTHPVQVKYLHSASGIAYHDYVIDVVTGETRTLKSIYEEAAREGINSDEAVVEYAWKAINLHLLE